MSLPTGPVLSLPSYASDLWKLVLLLGFFFFAALGLRPLANPDEGRYTEIPREMIATGDYVTPRLNGVKYFEKPPLMYWLTAAALKVFGLNEFAARFWCAAFGLLGALLTYVAARALYDRSVGLFAAGVLSTSLLYYGLSHLVILDLAVSVLIAAALFAFIVGVQLPAGAKRRWLFWGFYAAMALAALTKGLIGIALPCAVVFFWVLLLNRWSVLRPFYPFSGSALLLIIAVPWHVLAAQRNADFLYFYFVHEHYLRYVTKIHGRYEPFWFFGLVLLAGLFPWVAFFFQSLKHDLREGWRGRGQNETAWFLVIWLVFILLFFSKSQSQLIPYILPVFPAAAVLIGCYFATAWTQRKTPGLRTGFYVYAGLSVVLGTALFFIKLSPDPAMRADLRPWQQVISALFITAGVATAWLTGRGAERRAFWTMIGGSVLLFIALNPVAAVADNRSTKPFGLALRDRLQPTDRVYAVSEYFQDLPVYLQRTVSVVDYEGELKFGIDAEPALTAGRFIKRERFIEEWGGAGRCFAVAKKRDVADLLGKTDFPHFVLSEFHGLILFANRAP